jgi:dihydroflavonol-4-reductase
MRVLVTGATGLVGNNVCRMLLDRGDAVRVLARVSSDPRTLKGLDVETVQGDVRDEHQVRRAADGVDGVIHCAAHVRIGWTELDVAREINVQGTQHVAQAARAAGVRLVHVSSVDALSAGSPNRPACEDDRRPPKTPCPYVVTKRAAEEAVEAEMQQGLTATIVNPGFMLGPWDWKPSSGQMIVQLAGGFAPVAPRGGTSVCDVRDVAGGILAALDQGQPGRRYILAGQNMTYLELWRQIARVVGVRGPWMRMGPAVRWTAGAVGDLWTRCRGREGVVNSAAVAMSELFHYYSSDRARHELGYTVRPVRASIEDAWSWLREYGYVRSKDRKRARE